MTEASTPADGTAPEIPTRKVGRPALRLGIVGIVLAGAVGFLLIKGLGSSLDYFKTVDQALASKTKIGTTEFRLEGKVKDGSVERTSTGASFVVAGNQGEVPVDFRGSPPQLFKAGMPVIVVGRFASASSDSFSSDQIMVKHSSNYVEKHPDRVKANDGSVN